MGILRNRKIIQNFALVTLGLLLFVGFQNFSHLKENSTERILENSSLSKQDLLEKQIDLKLIAAQSSASNKYLAEKCFETRVTCFGNRNRNKCLHDKIQQYQTCSHVKAKSLFGNLNKQKFDL